MELWGMNKPQVPHSRLVLSPQKKPAPLCYHQAYLLPVERLRLKWLGVISLILEKSCKYTFCKDYRREVLSVGQGVLVEFLHVQGVDQTH